MNTQHQPNPSAASAADILRYGTAVSRRCRGINAAGNAGLVYLLGCYRTWLGAEVLLREPDASSAMRSLRDVCDRRATPLMTTLRMYATQRLGGQVPTLDDEILADAQMQILPQDDWLAGHDAHNDRIVEDDLDGPDTGLTPCQVFTQLGDFADDIGGYWLLGRLEALTGLQAAIAVAVAVDVHPELTHFRG